MAAYRHPIHDAQPFEESQGTSSQTSPQELEAFYQDMQRKDLERKLSKRSTGSRWTRRKSVRKNSAANASTENETDGKPPTVRSNTSGSQPPPTIRSTSTSASKGKQSMDGAFKPNVSDENDDAVPPLASRSLIPDALPKSAEIPGSTGDWSTASFRIKYPIHNPNGPRWYRNIHLLRPSARPSSFFSPAFPPMSYAHEASQDPSRVAGPSRAPSASPLPTPDSSQSRIAEPTGKRSRKNSQTDNVDLLDVSDPWGQNWHHTSPYDLGYSNNNSPTSPDSESSSPISRPRRQSTISPPKPRLAPSPLSQSTSAVHLQPPSIDGGKGSSTFRVMRKLSKRRAPVLDGTFSPPPSGHQKKSSTSSAISPVGSSLNSGPMQSESSLNLAGNRKEKRGSFLGRVVRRFSILKRSSTQGPVMHHNPADSRFHSPAEVISDGPVDTPDHVSEPNGPTTEDLAPPHLEPLERTVAPQNSAEQDRRSSLSVEVPYATGKLTIANPDALSAHSTPAAQILLLPMDSDPASQHTHPGVEAPQLAFTPSRGSTVSPDPGYSFYLVSDTSSTILAHTKFDSERDPAERPPLPEKSSRRRESAAVQKNFSPRLAASDVSNRHSISSSLLVSPRSNAYTLESPLSVASLVVNPPTPHTIPSATFAPTPGPPVPPKLPEVQAPRLVNATASEPNGRLLSSNLASVKASTANSTGHESRQQAQQKISTPAANGKRVSSLDPLNQIAHSKEGSRSLDGPSQRHETTDKLHRQRERKERSDRSESSTTERQRDSRRDSRNVASPREVLRKQPPRLSSSPPREGRSSRRKEDSRVSAEKQAPQQPPAPKKSIPSSSSSHKTSQATIQRRPSQSARPVSEMPSSAELNSTKAKEAYEIERIWKSRSLHGLEPHAVIFPSFPAGTTTISYNPQSDVGSNPGSSHTSFTVQSPFQSALSVPHASHPTFNGHSPAVYPSTPSSAYSPSNASMNVQSPQSHRSSQLSSLPVSDATPILSYPTRRVSANPLPEPPKESPYRTSHDNGLEIWTKYTGLTTAH